VKSIIIIAGAAILIITIVIAIVVKVRRPRQLKTTRFQERWRDLQKLCANKDTWPQAIIAADKLLDEALKKKRFGGKSMGERLTKAQRVINDNEGVWFGHKLRSKLETDSAPKLKESEVKQALLGIRQALKDLGAFPHDK
jgi:hypothetical protein